MKPRSKLYPRCILLLAGVLLWTLYLCQLEMARYSIYTLFSYSIHQVLSVIPFLTLAGTCIWLAYVLIRGRKAYDWKVRLPFAGLLALLLVCQLVFLVGQTQLRTMTMVTTVVSSNPLTEKLVIESGDGQVTLDCPALVQNMVELGEQRYQVTYEYQKGKPTEGTLSMIKRVE